MNQPKPAMFFQVIRRFDIKGGGEGVVLLDVRASKKTYYVANSVDIPHSSVGSFIELPCRKKGDAVLIPDTLTLVSSGTLEVSARSICLQYLAHLYNGPLHVSRQKMVEVTTGRVLASFEPEIVFSDPILRLLESLHDTLHRPHLHGILTETNYLYTRKSVYTRFRDDERSYLTPRSLNYYPMEKLVRVTFSLGGVPEDISVQVKDDEFEKIKVMPAQVNITRTFRNEGWTSLRDIAHNEPQLRAWIKMFYDNGYGKPEVPDNHCK